MPAKAKKDSGTAGKKELIVPGYVVAALGKNQKARAAFDAFSYSHQKEYVKWITEAKREETRQKRIETMLGCLDGWPRANPGTENTSTVEKPLAKSPNLARL